MGGVATVYVASKNYRDSSERVRGAIPAYPYDDSCRYDNYVVDCLGFRVRVRVSLFWQYPF